MLLCGKITWIFRIFVVPMLVVDDWDGDWWWLVNQDGHRTLRRRDLSWRCFIFLQLWCHLCSAFVRCRRILSECWVVLVLDGWEKVFHFIGALSEEIILSWVDLLISRKNDGWVFCLWFWLGGYLMSVFSGFRSIWWQVPLFGQPWRIDTFQSVWGSLRSGRCLHSVTFCACGYWLEWWNGISWKTSSSSLVDILRVDSLWRLACRSVSSIIDRWIILNSHRHQTMLLLSWSLDQDHVIAFDVLPMVDFCTHSFKGYHCWLSKINWFDCLTVLSRIEALFWRIFWQLLLCVHLEGSIKFSTRLDHPLWNEMRPCKWWVDKSSFHNVLESCVYI